MMAITVWQFDVGVLYLLNIFEEGSILILFKILRAGPTFAIPTVYYLSYIIFKSEPLVFNQNIQLNKILIRFFNIKVLYVLIGWSIVVFLINWTDLGIQGLELTTSKWTSESFYFPVYGPLSWIYRAHMSSFVIFLFFVFLMSKKIANPSMRAFVTRFSLYSIWLMIFGYLNFSSGSGVLTSSFGIILFSTLIVISFINMNNDLKYNYYQLLEKQKKMDYTGNIVGSLIHEVKNTNQIIKGFSNMIQHSDNLSEKDKGLFEMIHKSSEHLGDLTNNYREYLSTSKYPFKREKLNEVLERAVQFSVNLASEEGVTVKVINNYGDLPAYMNKTYMEQIFINMIKNSIEAMPKDRSDKKIEIITNISKDSIIIDFFDTAKGIPEANWESVFDPFISFNERGMGMGLPFVKKIITEHLGEVGIVESSPRGTHFRIKIPQYGVLNIN